MLTHDCPDGVSIPGIDKLSSLRKWPEITLHEAWAHLELLEKIAFSLNPKAIFHGNFHIPYQEYASFSTTCKTLVTGLGHEIYGENGNLKLLTLSDLKNIVSNNF